MRPNTNSRLNLKGLWLEDFQKLLADWQEKPFRAKQLAAWIYGKRVSDFSQMTDASKSFRERLAQEAYISDLKIVRTETSQDKSIKFLFELEDRETIEAVFIKDKDRNTICISSQVGCPLACAFCATWYMGYKRNLTAGEIVDQIIQIKNKIPKNENINIILLKLENNTLYKCFKKEQLILQENKNNRIFKKWSTELLRNIDIEKYF